MSLEDLFDELERQSGSVSKDTIIKAPFAYPGSKSKSVEKILPHLPYTNIYVEPFGGSASILLARHKSKLEVFNDRYAGVTDFYKCLRDKDLTNQLIARLELTVHSREEFVDCKWNWDKTDDIVERAASWYYMTRYSFASLGRNWGRALTTRAHLAGVIRKRLDLFPVIHERFKEVQVENQDWYDCIVDYDSPDTVFYLDPPYIDAYRGTYKHEMNEADHRRLIDTIFSTKGFVALSGFSNPVYEERNWDDRHEWEAFVSIKPRAYTESNYKKKVEGLDKRSFSTEVLWIKEAE